MKYLVKTVETEIWNKEYIVEADSGDEAEDIVINWNTPKMENHSEKYDYTEDINILEIEPYNETSKT